MTGIPSATHWRRHLTVGFLVFSLAAVGCTPSEGRGSGPSSTQAQGQPTLVQPNHVDPTFVVNVTLTDEGIEPSTIFIPAGRHIRLVIRNRGTTEHHFRVPGVITSDLTWLQPAELDEYDISDMTPEELAEYGIVGDIDDIEHVLHHLTPSFVPFKETSMAGISPLPGELHGYTHRGGFDILSFFAISTGVYTAEDVRFPEFTARVVVFETEAS
jgi:hypothetical protein